MSSKPSIPLALIDAVIRQKCVVFVGAGLSRPAGLPDWKQLVTNLIDWAERNGVVLGDRSDFERAIEENKLLEVAQEMRELLGKEKFRQFMTEVFRRPDLKPTENHSLIARIPFSAAVTTNYENLIESGYTQVKGITPHLFTHQDTPELSGALRQSDFFVLKAHGTIDRIETIILSREDYRKVMHGQPAYREFLKTLLSTKTLLFIGFSLTDPDLRLLLDELRTVYEGYTGSHFALMDVSQMSGVEQRRFAKDFGVEIVAYTSSASSHPEVTYFLEELADKTDPKKQVFDKLLQIQKDLDDPNFHFIADTRGSITIAPKDIEAYENSPLTFQLNVEFDTKTSEGRAALEQWKDHWRKGTPLTLAPEYIKEFQIPEPMRPFADIDPATFRLTLQQRPDDKVFQFRIEIEDETGEVASIDYLQMNVVRRGTEEVMLNNERQPNPLKLAIVLSPAKGTVKMDCKLVVDEPFNVRTAFQYEKFLQVVERGGELRLIDLPSEVLFCCFRVKAGVYPSSGKQWLRLLEALVQIQKKASIPINISNRNISSEEAAHIFSIEHILTTGHSKIKSEPLVIDSDVKRAKEILDQLKNGEPIRIYSLMEENESISIFDSNISLGSMLVFQDCCLSEEDKATLGQKIAGAEANEAIEICLTPSPDGVREARFLKWLPTEEAAALKSQYAHLF